SGPWGGGVLTPEEWDELNEAALLLDSGLKYLHSLRQPHGHENGSQNGLGNPGEAGHPNYNKHNLPEAVIAAFDTLADGQRGASEDAMLRVTHFHSGVLNFCVEHTGDLTNRMASKWHLDDAGIGYVDDKVKKVLRTLNNRYGFAREHDENILNNVAHRAEHGPRHDEEDGHYAPLSSAEYRLKLDRLLKVYAEEHSKLTVYNQAQYMARQAAVYLGKQRWDMAIFCLEWLDDRLEGDGAAYIAAALEYKLNSRGQPIPWGP
ncbi:MAG: hypothetical protein Q7R39_04630, partial [Dehalococcoidia bacterium]|nr:hypothetical protein [Dehalococcoidia bacterium]